MRNLIGWVLALLMICAASGARAQETVVGYDGHCAGTVQASCIFKAAPGTLFRYHVVNWVAAAVVVYLVDSATLPTGGGANIVPVEAWPLASGGPTAPTTLDVTWHPDAKQMTNGIVIVCSSTGASGANLTYTAASDCTFEAEFH
jgi:hypothetical protein